MGANMVTLPRGNSEFFAPIHWAILENKMSILEYLVNGKADMNIQTRPKQEYIGDCDTPLHVAARYNSIPAMSLLLKSGAMSSLL
jgi:ankyrin repeat protein